MSKKNKPVDPLRGGKRPMPRGWPGMRDGINVARFAIKLKSLATQRTHETEALEISIVQVLGEEALRYARRNRPVAE